jgi:hypothetical protein
MFAPTSAAASPGSSSRQIDSVTGRSSVLSATMERPIDSRGSIVIGNPHGKRITAVSRVVVRRSIRQVRRSNCAGCSTYSGRVSRRNNTGFIREFPSRRLRAYNANAYEHQARATARR